MGQNQVRSPLPIILAGVISTLLAANLSAQANLLVGPTSLEFAVPDGGSQPLPQDFLIAATNGAASSTTGLPFEAHSTAPWLFVSQAWGATPAAPRVTVDATGLENGVYHGYISITSGMSTPAMLTVTLRVGGVVHRSSIPAPAFRPADQTIRSFPRGLTFIAKSGTGAPAPQSLYVPRSALENGVVATSSTSWLLVSPPALSGGFQEISVSANPEGLPPGQYTATVLLTTRAGRERTIPVTFDVGDDAHLVAEPSVLSFRAQPGGSMPSVQKITIKSTSQNLRYTASTQSGSWLAVGPQTGSTDGSKTITVAVNPVNLSSGTNTGSITVSAPGAMEPLVIPVTLTTSLQPDGITIGGQSNISVELSGALGGPLQSMTYQLTSSISGETFSLGPGGASWLSVTPQNGMVPATLMLTADPNQAGLGMHMAQFYIAGGAGTDDLNFFVTFTVAQGTASTINASPSALTFAYTIGGTVPPSQTIQLTSSSSNTFTASSDSSFVTVTPTQGTTSSTATTLTVSITPNGLSAGSHTANITVSGGLSAGTNAITIPVTINITSNAPACTIPVTQVSFSSFLGQGAPPSQTVQLSCNVTTSFTATPAQPTLDTVSPASGTINSGSSATLTISVMPGSLTSGSYGDVITIAGTGVPSIQLTVIYTISSATAITASPMNLSFTQVAGGAAPPTQTVMLTSGSPTGFSVMSDVNFVTTDISKGTTPATLTVTVNAIGLTANTYQGHLNITGGAAAVQVTVTVVVTASTTTATIVATPSSLTFSFVSGGS
ncbi:MAG TPA: BACON domain-containing carbohydrate-binding protein, partial [Bryobacteraceae bacterium]|nr:BACON domain-containing carbohydrate-binding protein [Bryobacteraceae bacterium]